MKFFFLVNQFGIWCSQQLTDLMIGEICIYYLNVGKLQISCWTNWLLFQFDAWSSSSSVYVFNCRFHWKFFPAIFFGVPKKSRLLLVQLEVLIFSEWKPTIELKSYYRLWRDMKITWNKNISCETHWSSTHYRSCFSVRYYQYKLSTETVLIINTI